jgi:hypothetical protein
MHLAIVTLPDGRKMIESTNLPGRTCAIQYSDDAIAGPPVMPRPTVKASRVQWIDNDPPRPSTIQPWPAAGFVVCSPCAPHETTLCNLSARREIG